MAIVSALIAVVALIVAAVAIHKAVQLKRALAEVANHTAITDYSRNQLGI